MKNIDLDMVYSEDMDELGFINPVRNAIEQVVSKVVASNKWFCFGASVEGSQVDVLQVPLGDSTVGNILASVYDESVYKLACYKYFLRNYLCYVEVPKIGDKKYSKGSYDLTSTGVVNTFEKTLATTNDFVIADWLGEDVDDLPDRYLSRLGEQDINSYEGEYYVLKPNEKKDGTRTVTCPKKALNLAQVGIRVTPIFALKIGVDKLYDLCQKDYYEIGFLKDNKTIRKITTTFNPNKVRDVYGEGKFFEEGIETMYNGDFLENPFISRGYIKVIELGNSKYDSPTRSINYGRITGFKKIDEVDTTFINIDIKGVMDAFKASSVEWSFKGGVANDIAEALVMMGVGVNTDLKEKLGSVTPLNLEEWVMEQDEMYSTEFRKQLALFMISNPQWFNNYTGEPTDTYSATDVPEDNKVLEDGGLSFDLGDFEM